MGRGRGEGPGGGGGAGPPTIGKHLVKNIQKYGNDVNILLDFFRLISNLVGLSLFS